MHRIALAALCVLLAGCAGANFSSSSADVDAGDGASDAPPCTRAPELDTMCGGGTFHGYRCSGRAIDHAGDPPKAIVRSVCPDGSNCLAYDPTSADVACCQRC